MSLSMPLDKNPKVDQNESMSSQSEIAVFDFDNTLTYRDSFLPFLFFMHGRWKACYLLALLIPSFIQYGVRRLSRQQVKEKIITRFLKGRSLDEVKALGTQYAHGPLDGYLKPAAIQRLAWHRAQGHRCVLVSASLEFYLIPWAQRHGFEAVLASRLETTPQGIVTGRLIGLNCWGLEKKRRLLDYLGGVVPPMLYAYGDSCGDKEMLEMADAPFYRRFA